MIRRNSPLEEKREYQRIWRAANRDKIQIWNKAWWAALSPEEKELQRARNRRKKGLPEPTRPEPLFCEICGDLPLGKLHLDHCHVRGVFRGWLCVNCNRALGYFKDNPVVLRLAADYLEK